MPALRGNFKVLKLVSPTLEQLPMATPKKEKPTKTKPSQKEPAPKAAPKGAAKAPVAAPAAAGKRPPEKLSKKSALRDSILARKAAMKPIAFSLDEVRAIAKTVAAKAESTAKTTKVAAKPSAALQAAAFDKPVKPNHFKAASLAEILGFNPKKTKAVEAIEARDVPEKFKRFHKLLMDMRAHLTEGIERHSEETLKRSAKEDAGDLSAYGQHMADAGTDTFDRDFALSLVSSEQEALSEIDAAIKRIRDGTYGVCEITGKPIAKDRLLAVPFTRYSAEAQKQIERNRHHSRTQAGLFGEGEEGGKIMEEDGGDGE
jgi:RNA polymerase-binding transcription factor DksA